MKKVKVAMCWDDGVYTDVKAIEIFKAHKAKATFNICPGRIGEKNVMPSWCKLTEGWSHNGFRGGSVGLESLKSTYGDFQVASHCWGHEVAGKVPHEEFMEAAVKAKNWLEETFQKPCTGFAWPCGGVTQEAIDGLKAAGFTYARGTGRSTELTENREIMNISTNCHFMSRDFLSLYEQAKAGCGLFYFWGHTYEMLDYDKLYDQLDQKIKYISEDAEAEWVDVVELAAELEERMAD